MSEVGHSRPIDTPPAVAARPLRAESGPVDRQRAKSALCQKRTNALHRKALLFDYLVGDGEELIRHLQAERLRGLDVDDKLELCRLLNSRRLMLAMGISPTRSFQRTLSMTQDGGQFLRAKCSYIEVTPLAFSMPCMKQPSA